MILHTQPAVQTPPLKPWVKTKTLKVLQDAPTPRPRLTELRGEVRHRLGGESSVVRRALVRGSVSLKCKKAYFAQLRSNLKA